MDQKIDALAAHLRNHRFLIVWDNFEVVRGIPGIPVAATLSGEDQALLKTFLAKLRGGHSKVIITSRSDEEWLETPNRYEIPLGGLQGEERWNYCEVILRDLGLTIDRKDADLVTLMDLLGGHPLAMRVILPRLAKLKATALIQAFGGSPPGPRRQAQSCARRTPRRCHISPGKHFAWTHSFGNRSRHLVAGGRHPPSDRHVVRGSFLEAAPPLVVDLRRGHVPVAE